MSIRKKGLREEFATFFEAPDRATLRELLRNTLGESTAYDFKSQWPESSALARHVLALGNSGKGCIIAGVEDESWEPIGLETLEDQVTMIERLKRFVPTTLLSSLEIIDFHYESSEYPKLVDKKFQVLFVEADDNDLPYISLRDGESIRESAVYIRRGPASVLANHDELQRLINRRLETGYSSTRELDLKEHLKQLKLLYGHISREFIRKQGAFAFLGMTVGELIYGDAERTPNPKFPEEDFEDFIIRMIHLKKRRIERELDVGHLSSGL